MHNKKGLQMNIFTRWNEAVRMAFRIRAQVLSELDAKSQAASTSVRDEATGINDAPLAA